MPRHVRRPPSLRGLHLEGRRRRGRALPQVLARGARRRIAPAGACLPIGDVRRRRRPRRCACRRGAALAAPCASWRAQPSLALMHAADPTATDLAGHILPRRRLRDGRRLPPAVRARALVQRLHVAWRRADARQLPLLPRREGGQPAALRTPRHLYLGRLRAAGAGTADCRRRRQLAAAAAAASVAAAASIAAAAAAAAAAGFAAAAALAAAAAAAAPATAAAARAATAAGALRVVGGASGRRALQRRRRRRRRPPGPRALLARVRSRERVPRALRSTRRLRGLLVPPRLRDARHYHRCWLIGRPSAARGRHALARRSAASVS